MVEDGEEYVFGCGLKRVWIGLMDVGKDAKMTLLFLVIIPQKNTAYH